MNISKLHVPKESLLYNNAIQYCAKRMQMNFDKIRLLFSLEISAKFHRNFGGKSVNYRPKVQRNFAEPHESWNTGRKFANLTTKFRLEFVRTEMKIQEPNRNIVILKLKFRKSVG